MISILGDRPPAPLLGLELSDVLRRYLEIRPEHGQPICFVALVEGLKPVMDDWVPRSQLEAYTQMCEDAGLYVSMNAQFRAIDGDETAQRVVGRGTLTTTRAYAHSVSAEVPDASVHVFAGADRVAVERTRAAGWYPLVIGGRATSKPWIDHLWFGEGLGYPACCTEAFAMHNNWSVNNMPYQAWRATKRASMLCNSLMRFTGLTWAAHLPCRYDCETTATAAAATRSAMQRHSPGIAEYVDEIASRPYLVCNEWEAFALNGRVVEPGVLSYDGVTLTPTNHPNLALFEALSSGSRLEIRDDLVLVLDGDKVTWVEQCDASGFAPRIPFILDFSKAGRSG